jgi:hypothetical protein
MPGCWPSSGRVDSVQSHLQLPLVVGRGRECVTVMDAYNSDVQGFSRAPHALRLGLHSGFVVVATLSSETFMNTKQCSECKNTKPVDEFDGANAGCKECIDTMLAGLTVDEWETLQRMIRDVRMRLHVTYAPSLLESLRPEFWKAQRYFMVAALSNSNALPRHPQGE